MTPPVVRVEYKYIISGVTKGKGISYIKDGSSKTASIDHAKLFDDKKQAMIHMIHNGLDFENNPIIRIAHISSREIMNYEN